MNLFDFIRNRRNNNLDDEILYASKNEMPSINAVVETDNPLISGQVGNAVDNSTLLNRIRNIKDNINLYDKYTNPTNETQSVTTDDEGNTVLNMNAGTPVLSRRGFFNDVKRGAEENYNTPFSSENWREKTNNNMNKNFATRLGEVAGSIGRIAASPLGRGLITAGLVGATGGNGLQALTFGTHAGALNQKFRNNDALYRNALNDMGINTDDVKGYIGKDEFSNIANNNYKQNSLLVRQQIAGQTDNTKRANMIMSALKSGMITPKDAQQMMLAYGITFDNLQESNDTQLLPFKQYALQVAPQISLGNLGVAQGNLNLANERFALDYQKYLDAVNEKNNPQISKADKKAITENMQTLADIDAGISLIKKNPSAYGPAKGLLPASILNITDKKGIPTRTQIDNITAVYRKWLTGAQMSDAERKAYERFLPAPTDTGEAVLYKLQGMRDSIQRKNDVILGAYNMMPNQNNGLNVDMNALDAELKRRGL